MKKIFKKSISIVLRQFCFSHTFKVLQYLLNRLKYLNNFDLTKENNHDDCNDNDDSHEIDCNYSYDARKMEGTLHHRGESSQVLMGRFT